LTALAYELQASGGGERQAHGVPSISVLKQFRDSVKIPKILQRPLVLHAEMGGKQLGVVYAHPE
jgi:hypothetical protein